MSFVNFVRKIGIMAHLTGSVITPSKKKKINIFSCINNSFYFKSWVCVLINIHYPSHTYGWGIQFNTFVSSFTFVCHLIFTRSISIIVIIIMTITHLKFIQLFSLTFYLMALYGYVAFSSSSSFISIVTQLSLIVHFYIRFGRFFFHFKNTNRT